MEKTLEDLAPQVTDLLGITPLLRTVLHNLLRIQPTVVEQVGQSPLTCAWQEGLEHLPKLVAVKLVFHAWLVRQFWHKP